MKKCKDAIILAVLTVLLFSAGAAAAMSFPVPVQGDYTPIITMPSITFSPDLILSPDRFKEISTDTGAGDFSGIYPSGMDYGMNGILAVGTYDGIYPETGYYEIRFFDGRSWISREVSFRPYMLEWEPDYTPLLYATDGLNIHVSSNPTAEVPVWTQITSNEDEASLKGMYVNSSGTLYVVDAFNSKIQYYRNGEWKTMSFPDITCALTDITAVGFDYYVTDMYNSCIWHRNFLGQWRRIEDEDYIKNPTFIDSDSEGNLYIMSYAKNSEGENKKAIVKYKSGSFSIFVPGGDGVGYIKNTFPVWDEFCINHHDRLFYSDMANRMIIKEKDDINEITGLTINDFQFQLMEGWTQASMTVESDVTDAEILAYQMCPYSTVAGAGTHPLEFGENVFPLTCIPEIGESKEYTVTITRELSDNALLSDVLIDSVSIDGFNPNIFAYTGINFPNEKDTIELTAIPRDPNATVSGAGPFSLDVGDNLFIVSVLAQDEVSTQQYVFAINRAEAPASPTPTPSPSPSASPTPAPTPTPTGSTTPTPAPTASPSATPEPTKTPTTEPSTSETSDPSPTPDSSSDPSAAPLPSEVPSLTPEPSPSAEPVETDTPGNGDREKNGFGNWLREHPGITAITGVALLGLLILVAQQISKKGKKKKAQKNPE